ncbi:hypothetical protein CDL15_Pgr023342 [Punica granatum]|uniref:Uncharacterized protein n=1 Tax=Punica granatum TaxID=22663 RepID=A0A218Y2E0_PUNGR|nr:hypothetical protein CDL15_Pgr023342 [Punica granatum]PKI36106.1 hypothetical protein CRG98_043498 [Punica granatum]
MRMATHGAHREGKEQHTNELREFEVELVITMRIGKEMKRKRLKEEVASVKKNEEDYEGVMAMGLSWLEWSWDKSKQSRRSKRKKLGGDDDDD